jgi:hypothetical protein
MTLNAGSAKAFRTPRTKREGVYVGRSCALKRIFNEGLIDGGGGGGTVTSVVVVGGFSCNIGRTAATVVNTQTSETARNVFMAEVTRISTHAWAWS